MADPEINLDLKAMNTIDSDTDTSSPVSYTNTNEGQDAEIISSPSPSHPEGQKLSSWRDWMVFLLHSICSSTGDKSSFCTRATLVFAIGAFAFAAYQVYLQKVSNLFAERSFAIGVWKDCQNQVVSQNVSICAYYVKKTYSEIASRSTDSTTKTRLGGSNIKTTLFRTEDIVKFGKCTTFILAAGVSLFSRKTMKEGRKTVQNMCSSFVGFAGLIAILIAAVPGFQLSSELIRCGIAASFQCWVMCWNLSVCARNLMDAEDLRNDEEVLLRGREEDELMFRREKWTVLCGWLFFAAQCSSWIFTASIIATWLSTSMHCTIFASLVGNVAVSVLLGLATLWKSLGQDRLEESRKKNM